MRMFRKVLLTLGLLLLAEVSALAQGTMKGTVIDAKSKEPMPFVNVIAKQDGKQVLVGVTDFDGIYTIKPLPVGKYDLEVKFVGYATYVRTGINVTASGFTIVDVELNPSATVLDAVEIVEEKVPVIEIGTAESGQRLSSDDIARMPGNSVESIVAAVGGVGYSDGGTGSARGESGMVTMQGNVRKRTNVNVPKDAIAEIQVILGGTPASIGEAIGGTQIITLKPPTSQFKGMVRWEGYLDYRLLNTFMVYLTGPVIKKNIKNSDGSSLERTLVGFRFTGQAQYEKSPFYRVKGYRYQIVNDEKVRMIEDKPLTYDPVTGAVRYTGETTLRGSDFHEITRLKKKDFDGDASRVPNLQYYGVAMEGALDFRFSDYATLAVTTELNFSYGPNSSLMPLNMSRCANDVSRDLDWSVTVDFTQRFPDEEPSNVDNAEGSSSAGKAIKNVMYNITAMFERDRARRYNEVFGGDIKDVFKYGYYGRLETNQQPSYELNPSFNYMGISRPAMVQNSWYDIIDWSTYEPYAGNQVLANYNLQLLKNGALGYLLKDAKRHSFLPSDYVTEDKIEDLRRGVINLMVNHEADIDNGRVVPIRQEMEKVYRNLLAGIGAYGPEKLIASAFSKDPITLQETNMMFVSPANEQREDIMKRAARSFVEGATEKIQKKQPSKSTTSALRSNVAST